MHSRRSSGMPTPVSLIEKCRTIPSWGSASSLVTRRATSPRWVNLMAFPSRLTHFPPVERWLLAGNLVRGEDETLPVSRSESRQINGVSPVACALREHKPGPGHVMGDQAALGSGPAPCELLVGEQRKEGPAPAKFRPKTIDHTHRTITVGH